ncbi:MAG: hypothetical protein P8Y27_20895 [Chromatiaceae bacterium]
MTMPPVEERVDRLEEAIDRFVANVGVEFNKLYNSQMRTDAWSRATADLGTFQATPSRWPAQGI